MSFFDRLAEFKAECETCAPGNCVGCRRDGDHCDDCPSHQPEVELTSDVTVTAARDDVGAGVEAGDLAPGQPKRPAPAPPKWRCTKCHLGTTKTRAQSSGMCGKCERIFTRPGLDATLETIPVEWEKDVVKAIREQPTLDRAAAQMKKKHPLKGGRDWDMTLVLMVNERRLQREGKYW